ncbi:DUF3352 domain-containing protein [Flavobacterium sp. ASW18X]|uniref:DUF3352 domain-containing protein n=1 Tax=Flavobacterium sp. ASW18X TaxID=2572595 RepID=UPI0010AE324B|nr:DUF3352 domain-containing protein [Flavobacterium sp. ASW18X]TKD67038.1 DUF3352 domain-containing protein [Flavobacterium sp. ASW18X]
MTKKRILWTIFTLMGFYACYLLYVFVLSPKNNLQPIYLIPKDAVFIIESDKPVEGWQKVSDSDAWEHLTSNSYFSELTESIQKIDTVFKDQQRLFKQFDGRSLYISIHMISKKDYGIFYVLDLKKLAKLKLVKSYLNTLLNDDYVLSKRNYHGQEILELLDKRTKKTMYISFIKNQLIASYTHTLVEASIDQHKEPFLGRNLDFLRVNEEVGYADDFRLYIQYKYLDDYLGQYFSTVPDALERLNKNLKFTGFSLDLENEVLTAEGFSNITEANEVYLNALRASGTSERNVPSIAPKTTSLYVGYGFKDFATFYANFEDILKADSTQFQSYKNNLERVERFLKINVQEQFVSWIGNEIAVLQLTSNLTQDKDETALLIKTKDAALAKEQLDFVLQQIRKKTPVKFKSVDYKNHYIHFLSIKGFFKLLLGNRFNAFDKPYFTQIEDYVVFSDNPNTLKSIITDVLDGSTLENSQDFTTFNNRFEQESSVYVYANVPLLYKGIYQEADYATKKLLTTNKDYFICFPQLGIQLTPEEELFKSTLVTAYQPVGMVAQNQYYGKPEVNKRHQPISKVEKEITEAVFNLKPMYPKDLNAKSYQIKYASGALKMQVGLTDGKKNGRYKAYYPDGTRKMTGKFKEDRQAGTWRYYNTDGQLVLKKRF